MKHISNLANLLSFSTDDVLVETMINKYVLLPFVFHLRHHFHQLCFGLFNALWATFNTDQGRFLIRYVDCHIGFVFQTIDV